MNMKKSLVCLSVIVKFFLEEIGIEVVDVLERRDNLLLVVANP